MSMLEKMRRVLEAGAEAPAEPAAAPYVHLLKEFAAGIEGLYPDEVGAVVQRTPTAGGWEVLAWPKYQMKVRVSLFAAYPTEGGALVYNRLFHSPESFEAFLMELFAGPTVREALEALRRAARDDVDGWVVLPTELDRGGQVFYLQAENRDFRIMATAKPGAEVELKVRVAPHQSNGARPSPGPELTLDANFGGQTLTAARLHELPRSYGRWTHTLRGTRG